MADRDYGAGRYGEQGDNEGGRQGRYQSQSRGYRRPIEGDDDDDTREERAFGGYPDYREDRFDRQAQTGGRYGSRGRNYGRERSESPRYQGSRSSYPQEERGDEWRRRSPYAPDYTMSGDGWQGQHHGGVGGSSEHGRFGQTQYPQNEDFDPDYSEWRQNQMRTLDDDYRAYRQERQKKFSDEFETWRKGRDRSADRNASKQMSSGSTSSKTNS